MLIAKVLNHRCSLILHQICGIQVLQEFLNQNKGSDMLGIKLSDMDFQFENFKDLVEDLRSGSHCNQPSWR